MTVIDVPGMPGVPGANVPPDMMVMVGGSIVPSPVSVPPELTVKLDVESSAVGPFTSSMPPLIVVAPV